jgi:hypothetical protein
MNKPKCGCRKCKANKIYKTKNHPWYEQAFWESINGGKTDRNMTFKYRMKNLKEFQDTGIFQY